MSLIKISRGVRTRRDVLGYALIADDFSALISNRIAAEQAMQALSVFSSEKGFKVFHKPVSIDLSFKYFPVCGFFVNLFCESIKTAVS